MVDLSKVDLAAKVAEMLAARLAARERNAAEHEAKGERFKLERHGPRGLCYFHGRAEAVAAYEVAAVLGMVKHSKLVGRALSRTPGIVRDRETTCWTTEAEVARAAAAREEIANAQALEMGTADELEAKVWAALAALEARVRAKLAAGARPAEVAGLYHELEATAK